MGHKSHTTMNIPTREARTYLLIWWLLIRGRTMPSGGTGITTQPVVPGRRKRERVGTLFVSEKNMEAVVAVRSRLRGRRVPGSNPDPTQDPACMGELQVKSYVVDKCPPAGVVRKFVKGVPAQVSSSSSGLGSKLRGPSLTALVLL
ncbi:hypothetical protein AVEN_39585-1 [Araneus ventricosus]|uniref:Uncharacterized protein n=1 Tax=Araneus ventricosus TaxID=182803 RepID=A0A4Y2HLB4_ARAVE|nr:hypothetical protein AVEN_39585-1 [Araneus ventricosus]